MTKLPTNRLAPLRVEVRWADLADDSEIDAEVAKEAARKIDDYVAGLIATAMLRTGQFTISGRVLNNCTTSTRR